MSDWTMKTWKVDSCDSNVGLLAGDQLSFPASEGDEIRVQNRSFAWGTVCDYDGDFNATVIRGEDVYSLECSGARLTCTLSTTAAPSASNFPLLGKDDLPGRGARRKVRAKSRSNRESECEFPTLDGPPPSSWTAIEGGGGQV